jgi:photosystem II stability/assembly factor-like uncharacterized protein
MFSVLYAVILCNILILPLYFATAGRVTYTSRAKPAATTVADTAEVALAEAPIEGNTVLSDAP